MEASIYLIQAIHGLVYGMLLFLVASGLTLGMGLDIMVDTFAVIVIGGFDRRRGRC